VHIPGFWILVACITLPVLRIFAPRYLLHGVAVFLALFVHILLDGIAGGVVWFWPFDATLYRLFDVPAIWSNWILNFILHPIFLVELIIWGLAIFVWIKYPTN